jgi:hypothetical protein
MAFGSQIAKLFGKAPSLPYRSVYINPFNGNNYLKYAQHDGLEVDEERVSFNTISQKQVKKINPHINNTVRNTKYTIWNFIFVLFIEQFSLHMNQYFLLLAVGYIIIVTNLTVYATVEYNNSGKSNWHLDTIDYSPDSSMGTVAIRRF